MSVHPEGGGSVRDARVSLISVDVVSGLVSAAECDPMSWFDEVGGRWSQPYPSSVTVPIRVVAIGGP
jgi:hypothetical protein